MTTIRLATTDDLITVQQLAHAIWPHAYDGIVAPEQLSYMLNMIYSIPSLQDQLQKQHHTFLIVEDNDQAVGFASYSPMEEGVYKLHKLYVLPVTQGKGLGKSMIDFIIDSIRPQGAKALRLNVNRYNKARFFYEKLGFTVIKEEDIDIGNNYFMIDYVMELQMV